MVKHSLVKGMPITDVPTNTKCESCIIGKQTRLPFQEGRTRATKVGELIHSDVCGPMPEPTTHDYKYFVTFIDDYSGLCVIKFMRQKSEVLHHFQEFYQRTAVTPGVSIATLRSDNGKEYINSEFAHFLSQKGVLHQTSTPRTPEQKGVAERRNRAILDCARTMLLSAKLEGSFWADACHTAVYIQNRLSTRVQHRGTPFEAWFGHKPDISHLRIFGSTCYMHIHKTLRTKFQPTAIKCVFVGYSDTQKAYRLWDPVNRTFPISRDVSFDELQIGSTDNQSPTQPSAVTLHFFGIPTHARTDGGLQFASAEIQDFAWEWGFKNTMSSPTTPSRTDTVPAKPVRLE